MTKIEPETSNLIYLKKSYILLIIALYSSTAETFLNADEATTKIKSKANSSYSFDIEIQRNNTAVLVV